MTKQDLSEGTPAPKARRPRRAAALKRADASPSPSPAAQDDAQTLPSPDTAPENLQPLSAVPGGAEEPAPQAPKARRSRRGGRGRKSSPHGASAAAVAEEESPLPNPARDELSPPAGSEEAVPETPEAGAPEPRSKARRSRRGGRGRGKNAEPAAAASEDAVSGTQEPGVHAEPEGESAQAEPARRQSKKIALPAARDEEKTGKRKMFISVVPEEQVEVVLTEQGDMCEYYLEMFHQTKIKGNIYRGVIQNIDTNLQAAFVSYGGMKNGFLQIDEVHPEYWLNHHEEAKGKKYPLIQKALKVGQEVLVQVVKEPVGSKGAFLTTWISLAGRFLVLTPGQEQIGISRKVEDEDERARLRELMNGIDPGAGLGVIVRTVSAGTSKTTLQKDLQYLKRLWKGIRAGAEKTTAPALVYQEPGLARRAVRDYLTDDVTEVWVDDEESSKAARETISLLFPRKTNLVRLHQDPHQSLWERFDIQRRLEQIYSREINLPSGGRLVFDQTEALMAIDINSGKIHGKGNFEAMALKTNMEAAETIARQLRLRDIGGQIVIDFIEMRDKNHVRDVEKTLRQAMKNDRARHDIGRISSFGLLEVVRQRTGSSALAGTTELCPCCGGSGLRRNMEWQALQTLRAFSRQMRALSGAGSCNFELPTELGLYLLNEKRERLRELERLHNMHIEIRLQQS